MGHVSILIRDKHIIRIEHAIVQRLIEERSRPLVPLTTQLRFQAQTILPSFKM